MEKVVLNNKVDMPLFGLGVFQVTDEKICEKTVLNALKIGYRMIDTAACYGNEQAVGRAIESSNVERKDLFIVSKVWIQDSGYEKTKKSFAKTLENLQTDYLDLYLIHMPYGDYHGSWKAMEELYKEGKIKAIGVCNFLEDRLVDLILSQEITPMVNQMEIHPFCQRKRLRQIMDKYDIKAMAWAPFAEGKNNIFANEILMDIAKKYQSSSAQIILAWLRQNNIIAIPKSVHENRLKENFDSKNIILSQEDLAIIRKLDTANHLILDIQSLNEVYRLHNIKFVQ